MGTNPTLCESCGRIAVHLTDVGAGTDVRKVCDNCLVDQEVIVCWRCKTLILRDEAQEVATEQHLRKVCEPCRKALMGN